MCVLYWDISFFFLPSDTFHVTRYTQKFTHFQEIFIFYNFHFVANLVFFTPKWSRITKLILWKVWDLEVKPSRRYQRHLSPKWRRDCATHLSIVVLHFWVKYKENLNNSINIWILNNPQNVGTHLNWCDVVTFINWATSLGSPLQFKTKPRA